MIATMTEAYVDSVALNAAAIKNGRDLVKKNSFPKLCRSEDETLIFGECKGSGKEPYRCSVDFVKPDSPVFRCSCPSRQFPCKHILGLMYAYVLGKEFQVDAIPQDIADKRDKVEKREEKKKEAADAGEEKTVKRKPNKSALAKKRAAQLEGIGLLEKLVHQIVQNGLAGLDAKTAKMMEDQAKQLGNYYIPGVQAAFRELLFMLRTSEDRERVYTEAMDRLIVLQSLVKKSRDYVTERQHNPELPPDTESSLEEQLGHAWQLAELREHGLARPQAELAQLTFRSYKDEARGEYVDEGFWMELQSGDIFAVRSYRPFRAAKHLKEEDSFFSVVSAKELLVYPGDLNPRARWEDMTVRDLKPEDQGTIRSHARRSYVEAVKTVKNQLKNPLSDKHPVMLLHYAKLGRIGEDYVLEDEQGKRIVLGDIPALGQSSTQLLPLLKHGDTQDQAMLVMFEHDFAEGRLLAQPLALVTSSEIVRFIY
ncbi:SWIM zinc finger [Paenibacillus tianmuensis]|uniref:SWIM zinc finger n=1 Tax=Paenibacillus tianmuensis TaxID=624147 RepID=A0A1G4S254_9BACL|nr:SWIM zinc finger [Paenibacillus tianmuensis]